MNNAETYQYVESTDGKSTFYFTDCGNRMFYIDKDPMKYHGCLCPKCYTYSYYYHNREYFDSSH